MKQLIAPIAIIVALIAFFVIIDRKDFYSGDDIAVQKEDVTRKPTSVTMLKPVEQSKETKPTAETKPVIESKPAETKPVAETNPNTVKPVETKPVAETKPIETKPVVETKPAEAKPAEVKPTETKAVTVKPVETKPVTETKPTETKPVVETKPVETKPAETKPVKTTPVAEEKLASAAIPVVTAEEAKKLNAEALAEFEKLEKIRAKERERLDRGFSLAWQEDYKELIPISLSKANEDRLTKNQYVLDDFKSKNFPKLWSIDYSSIPSGVSFQPTDDGLFISSNQGAFRITGQRFNGMRTSFIFEITVNNKSDKESEIVLGINNSGLVKNGNTILISDKISGNEEKTIETEIDVFDRFANIAPNITIKGDVLIEGFKMYRKDFDNFTIVEGEITERSVLPDPKDTDYPNCRYTAHFVGNAIISGMPCNKELSLSIDGFENQKILGTNAIKVGDKIRCAIVPTDSIPDELASIQEADDLSLFALDSYLVTTLQKINTYTDVSTANGNNAIVYFKSEIFDFKSVFGRFNDPIPSDIRNAQKRRIEKDLSEANAMISYLEENRDEIEAHFQKAWSIERDKDSSGYNRVGNLVWRNKNNSFWGLSYNYTLIPKTPSLLSKDKLDAVVALKDFLESNGIQLIVSLVPDRSEIASRVINPEFKDIPVYQLATFVKQLSEAGVECPYNAKQIIENYDLYPFAYLYPLDGHPASTTQHCIAEVVANRLSDYHFPKDLDINLFSHAQVPTYDDDNNGKTLHKYPVNCDIGDNTPDALYTSDEIRYDGKRVVRDTSSEVLVIGNSYAYTPGSTSKQHSFPAFLSERMLHPIDDYMVSSQGPMTVIIQRFFEKPESFLLNKKVLVMQMSENHLIGNNIVWNNISEMDKRKLMLNGKKLVASLSVQGNGDWTNAISNDLVRSVWGKFAGKTDYMCLGDDPNELMNQIVSDLDSAKPFVCVVQTVRSPIYASPILICNGIEASIPASHGASALFWQDLYFTVPAGTSQIKLELQGKANTLVGFNKVLIYQ